MTSSEATGFLPKSSAGLVVGQHRRSTADWAALLAFGAIQWPWLLRSLSGGRAEDRSALLDRLELPHDALPSLGSWKADVGFLRMIADHIGDHRPKLVVEFGAGASTLVAAQALKLAGGGRLVSFEQHPDFVDATRKWLHGHGLEADLRAVPLRASPARWPGLWYDHGELPEPIDLLLVDGPPWTIHPLTRGAAASVFDHIAPGGTIMLDDAARPGERIVAQRWRRQHPDFQFELVRSGTKGTLVGTRSG